MPLGLWLGVFAALAACGIIAIDVLGLLGFVKVEYPDNMMPEVELITSLPVIVLLISSAYGFFKRANWSRVSALSLFPIAGIASLCQEWWGNNLTLKMAIEMAIFNTVLSFGVWYYLYKKYNVVKYFRTE